MKQEINSVKRGAFNAAVVSMIAAAVISASVLAGCSNSGDTKETKVVTETQIVTELETVTKSGNKSDNKEEKATEATKKAEDKQTSEKSENSEKTENSQVEKTDSKQDDAGSGDIPAENTAKTGKSTGSIKGNGGTLVKNPTPNLNSDSNKNDVADNSGYKSNEKTLNIEGKKVSVGDTVTVTYYLTSAEKLLNYQGFIQYDPKCLSVTDVETLGQASSSSLVNYDESKGLVYFNGSKLTGYNYSSGGEFLTVTYKVTGGGECSPKLIWEVISNKSEKSIISNVSLSYTYE